jgi:hypothetical protein
MKPLSGARPRAAPVAAFPQALWRARVAHSTSADRGHRTAVPSWQMSRSRFCDPAGSQAISLAARPKLAGKAKDDSAEINL